MDGVIQGLWLLGFRLYGFRAWGFRVKGFTDWVEGEGLLRFWISSFRRLKTE